MEPTQFQTSFIPKKPIQETREPSTRRVNVFLFIANIIFIASIAAAGFVYLTKGSLTRSIASMRTDLETAEQAFESNFISDLQNLDKRINTASIILQNHISVSPILKSLQELTLSSVQFTKFSHTITGSGASSVIVVSMSGKTDEYESLALQSDALTKNKYITNPVFSNLNLDERGNVLFDLTFFVDPNLVLFGESVKRLPGGRIETSSLLDESGTDVPSESNI
jgi:hypothetical protein